MNQEQSGRILIAASGTGGHLIPALQIAKALKAQDPKCEVLFVGAGRALEAQIIDAAGFRRAVIKTVGLKRRGLKGLLEYLITLPLGLFDTAQIFSKFKPQAVIGVGGYVSFIPVLLGFLLGKVTWIHEAELKPGLANLALSLIAKRVSLGFEKAQFPKFARTVYTGQPVMTELVKLGESPQSFSAPRCLLILGGSQGAEALDRVMLELAPFLKQASMRIWHQCRTENLEKLERGYDAAGLEAKVMPFIVNTLEAYAWSDLIISRAGAGTVMELGLVNRPVILVPYPYAQGNHQFANAQTLSSAGKGLLVQEGQDFSARMQKALETLLNLDAYTEMRSKPFAGRVVDAADRIAKGILALTGKLPGNMVLNPSLK